MQAGKVAGNGAVAAEGDGGSSLVDDAVSTLFTEPQSSTSGGSTSSGAVPHLEKPIDSHKTVTVQF